MSNAELPDRSGSQGVGMYVFALRITTDQVEGKAVLSGSSADSWFILSNNENERHEERRIRK